MDKEILKEAAALARDREHGAAQLYNKALSIFIKVLNQYHTLTTQEMLPLVEILLNAQPAMAPLINLCNRILLLMENMDRSKLINQLKEEATENSPCIKESASHLIPFLEKSERVVVFSYSSTALSTLNASGIRLPILTHIGHPIGDGLKSARLLKDMGFHVTITSDLSLPGMLSTKDLILTGCDAIVQPDMVNRAGTLPLALTAKHLGLPVIVVTEQTKILHPSLKDFLRLKDAPPEELLKPPYSYKVKHRYFEKIPLKLIHKVITQEGAFSPNEMVKGAKIEDVSPILLSMQSHLTG